MRPQEINSTPSGFMQPAQIDPVAEHERFLTNILPHHVACIDESGKYSFWNPYAERMFGYCAQEVVGVKGPEIILGAGYSVSNILKISVRDGIFSDEVLLRHRDGYVFPARLVIVPLKKHTGEVACYYEFAQDISEIKATKKEIEELKSALTVLLNRSEEEKKEHRAMLLALLNRSIIPHLKQIEFDNKNERVRASLEAIHAVISNYKTDCFGDLHSKAYELTSTEIQVAQFVIAGKGSKDIARLLSISPETVSFHRKNIRKKFGISNRKVSLRTHIATLKW